VLAPKGPEETLVALIVPATEPKIVVPRMIPLTSKPEAGALVAIPSGPFMLAGSQVVTKSPAPATLLGL